MYEPDATSQRRLGHHAAAVSSGRARLRPDSVGALVHEAIALALTRETQAMPADAATAAKAIVSRELAPVYRTALLHRVTTATAVYLRDLRRDPTTWTLMGAEMFVGEARLDLLFVDATGRIEADEIKTGLLGPAAALPWVIAQVDVQIALGRTAFGGRFGGVRVVDLARRHATLFESSGGRAAA
jgi:hypothetical protein